MKETCLKRQIKISSDCEMTQSAVHTGREGMVIFNNYLIQLQNKIIQL